jgi:hypothetical protein
LRRHPAMLQRLRNGMSKWCSTLLEGAWPRVSSRSWYGWLRYEPIDRPTQVPKSIQWHRAAVISWPLQLLKPVGVTLTKLKARVNAVGRVYAIQHPDPGLLLPVWHLNTRNVTPAWKEGYFNGVGECAVWYYNPSYLLAIQWHCHVISHCLVPTCRHMKIVRGSQQPRPTRGCWEPPRGILSHQISFTHWVNRMITNQSSKHNLVSSSRIQKILILGSVHWLITLQELSDHSIDNSAVWRTVIVVAKPACL